MPEGHLFDPLVVRRFAPSKQWILLIRTLFRARSVRNNNELSSKIIGAAIEVHKAPGPGLLESVYEECICHELSLQGLSFERQKPLSVEYKGKKLDCGYRLDLVAESKKQSDSAASAPLR